MYLADYHTHSRCSPDGSFPLADMARAAQKAGLRELCLTDHCDLLDANGAPDRSFRWDAIHREYAAGRKAMGAAITLRQGLELGEGWEDPELAARITGDPELDFVIGSVHNLSRESGGGDLYFVDYKNEDVCYEVLEGYVIALEKQAALESYDVLGHIIYPLRYMNERDGNRVSLERFFPRLEAVFKTAIGKGKGMELNTCRGRTVEDWRPILGLYRDCGGEIVTLGSDAHRPQDVAAGLAEGAGLLREFGFSLAVFEKRTPRLVSLSGR